MDKQDLEKSSLKQFLEQIVNPLGDTLFDNKQKTLGRLEGLQNAIDVIKNTALAAGKADGQANIVEQFAKDIKSRLALIDKRYTENKEQNDGPISKAKKSSKTKKKK